MADFTHKAYSDYLHALKISTGKFLRFDEYFQLQQKPEKFCLIRHDVDRLPLRALKMARLENELGIVSTYYIRKKPYTFKPDIIREIASLGHEIGYHYENLSDTNGNFDAALEDFRNNLREFRKITEVKTCAMHGQPLKPYDNRDLWRNEKNMKILQGELGILGEVYLNIDYSDIAYINDTGRNWTSGQSNRRDKVNSRVEADFLSGESLLKYLQGKPHNKICFQIHPERWVSGAPAWLAQFLFDEATNYAKILFSVLRK